MSWLDAPNSQEDWAKVAGQIELNEPPITPIPGKKIASGVIVIEPDGRVWLVAPTNAFAGYIATFPKGTQDPDSSLQATAIKEAFEESGLRVRITGLYGDVERSASLTRYYFAERTGGNPADMGWESQAVHLVPRNHLYELLNQEVDHPIAQALGSADPKNLGYLSRQR
jgi:ADP-ribose pyrophosphatase YjhB (NUDIX family)